MLLRLEAWEWRRVFWWKGGPEAIDVEIFRAWMVSSVSLHTCIKAGMMMKLVHGADGV